MLVLLLAVTFVVVPHFEHLVWWATSVLVLLLVWRAFLTVTQRPIPSRLLMLPLLIAASGAVYLQYRTVVGQQAGVTFLLLLMALKLLEMRARRDIFVVIFLSFFILLTQFLNGQEIHVAAMALLGVTALFFVLISVNLDETDLPAGRKFRMVGLTLLKAVAADRRAVPAVSAHLGPAVGNAGGFRQPANRAVELDVAGHDQPAARVDRDCVSRASSTARRRAMTSFTGAGRCSARSTARAGRRCSSARAGAADHDSGRAHARSFRTRSRWSRITATGYSRSKRPPRCRCRTISRPRFTADMRIVANDLVRQRLRYEMRSYTQHIASTRTQAKRSGATGSICRRLTTRARCNSPRKFAGRSGNDCRPRTRDARSLAARRLSVHAVAAAAGPKFDRRISVRYAAGLLRTLCIRVRLPDARARRSGARRDRLPGRRAQSGRWIPDGAAVRRARMVRSVACRAAAGSASIRPRSSRRCGSIRARRDRAPGRVLRCPVPAAASLGCARSASTGKRCKTRGTSGCCRIRRNASAT